jgi:hypothetical protein
MTENFAELMLQQSALWSRFAEGCEGGGNYLRALERDFDASFGLAQISEPLIG